MADKLQHTADTMPNDLTIDLLTRITDNFSTKHQIGHGGFGTVYKGVLENGEEIAVKKLDIISLDDVKFMNEFTNLMSVRHKNIVRLVGYCCETRRKLVPHNGKLVLAYMEERVLCFEYLQRGSLDNYLSDESSGFDWCTRYNIIKGTCEGVNYLHNGPQGHIFHLDLKPGNILLDKNNVPKIADFGLSRLFEKTLSHHTTKVVIGTPGYMPPEYIEKKHITEMFDVFSLGVIIIEIMEGPKARSKLLEMPSQEFIELVHENWSRRFQQTTPTYTSEEIGSLQRQVKTCLEMALQCVEADRHKRPTIAEVVSRLNELDAMFQRTSPSLLPSELPIDPASPGDQEVGVLRKFGPWGGKGGSAYDIEVPPHRLYSVTICSGEIIDSLAFSYIGPNGQSITIGPWGGNPGPSPYTIQLGPSEFLLEVSGTIGRFANSRSNVITSLTLVTNEDRYGHFGTERGDPFCTTLQTNCSIVGFFARASRYMHAIGVYVNTNQLNLAVSRRRFRTDNLGNANEKLVKIGPWGGNGGRAHDVNVAHHRLESIAIGSGSIVDSLAFSYIKPNGDRLTVGPWGGALPNPYTINLDPSESLLDVYGTIGPYVDSRSDVITSITFVTSKDTYGPYGTGGGVPFSTPVKGNSSIVGFFGYAGRYMHAIGVNVDAGVDENDRLAKIGPWGGSEGIVKDINVAVAPHHLESVTICSAVVIDSLAFSYSKSNGQKYDIGPWGGPGGMSHTVKFGSSEFLVRVFGTIGPFRASRCVVTSVTFVTNVRSYGPFGQGGGTPFDVPMQSNGKIVGFFGHARSYVEALGVYVRTY
nr:mannose/glucose-specific lectin-like [Oryza sativa Japonica Group]